MYLEFYGLNEKPFSISTDPRFLWLGEKHKEAYAVLKYGVMDSKGFLLLTGDVGAGKTTLIHALANYMKGDVIWATVPDPGLEIMGFYAYIADAFKISEPFETKSDFIRVFRVFLHQAYAKGKKVVLIIDESQRLTNELLEEIRLLSNIELDSVKLINIFFVGQSEFRKQLASEENKAINQRITVSYHIKPLTEKETGIYIRHRLKVAGAKKNIFSFVSLNQIHEYSKGCPRLINILCDMALLTGYSKGEKKIGYDIIDESITSLRINEEESVEKKKKEKNDREQTQPVEDKGARRRAPVVAAVILAGIIAAGVVASHYIDVSGLIFKSVANTAPIKVSISESTSEVPEAVQEPGEEEEKNESGLVLTDTVKKEASLSEPLSYPSEPQVDVSEVRHMVIRFNYNSNDFPPVAYEKLNRLASFLLQNPEAGVFVSGYTDEHGTVDYNLNLSGFRANIVKCYLLGKGVKPERIKATGFGSTKPIASNSSMEGRSANRRVEIEVFNVE